MSYRPRSRSSGGGYATTRLRAPTSAQKRSRSGGVAARVYKNRVPGRNGSYQIPRGFVGLAGDAKYIDVPTGGAAVVYTMGSADADADLIKYLSIIPQDATVNGRIGKACQAQSLSVRGFVKAGTAGVATSWHIYWIWDYQPNKVDPQVFLNIMTAKENNSMPNRSNNARYKILKKIAGATLGNSGTPTTGTEIQWIETIVPMPADGFIQFEAGAAGQTGVAAQCIQGALLQLCISTGTTAANTATTWNATMRLNFKDVSA